jgi:GNAT superfamily N-acetyltransferase
VSFAVVRATPADRDAVVATFVAAFVADPAVRFFFPDDDAYAQDAAAFIGHLFDRRVANGSVWIGAGGAVAALWDLPSVRSSEPATLDVPADARERIARYDAAVHPALPADPHWYLGVLATRPDHAGRGLGRRLMAAGVAMAHNEGLPAVLETTNPSNVDLYLREGWAVYRHTAVDDVPPTWVMVNLPAVAPDQPVRDVT